MLPIVSRFPALLIVLVGLVPLWSTGAQDGAPPTEREQIAAAMRVLKSRSSSVPERDTAMAELLFLGIDGPKQLAAWVERSLKERGKASAKSEARILATFEKQAAALIAKRIKGKEELEIDKLRSLVRRHSRSADLSKQTIQEECDPAVERLTELLTASAFDVWGADADLRDEWEALLDARDREFYLLETWWAAEAAVLSLPEGGEKEAKRLKEPEWPTRTADELLVEVDRLAQLATPMSQSDRRIFDKNALIPIAGERDEIPEEGYVLPEEKLGVRFLNQRRVLLGLPAQAHDPKLSIACRGHSKDMAEHDFFSHDSPLKGKETPWARAALAGTSAGAENIAKGADTGEKAILQWWYSPGHHRNMMGGGARTGLGRFGVHWTQLFGG